MPRFLAGSPMVSAAQVAPAALACDLELLCALPAAGNLGYAQAVQHPELLLEPQRPSAERPT